MHPLFHYLKYPNNCQAHVRDLEGKRAYCERARHTLGGHISDGMMWSDITDAPLSGIQVITHVPKQPESD